MRVGLGIPFWGDNPERVRNYQWVNRYMTRLYPWDHLFKIDQAPENSWNRGKARNYLVASALRQNIDVLVLADSDTFVEKDPLLGAIRAALTGEFAFAFDNYVGLTESGTNCFLDRGFHSEGSHHVHHAYRGSFGGVFAFRPELWKLAGGSPEMEGWGFEDIITVVNYRTLTGFETTWRTGTLTHLYHDRDWAPFDVDYTRNIAVCKRFEAAQYDIDAIRALRTEYADLFRM